MLLVLCGYSAAGKDTYQDILLEKDKKLNRALSATTRPIRPGETDGKEYIFATENYYRILKKNGEVLSERVYNTIQNGYDAIWRYGLLKQNFEENNYITVLDHEGAARVRRILGKEHVRIVYMYAPDDELHERSRRRHDEAAEFNRRLKDDKIKFIGIEKIADLMLQSSGPMSVHEANIREIQKLYGGAE